MYGSVWEKGRVGGGDGRDLHLVGVVKKNDDSDVLLSPGGSESAGELHPYDGACCQRSAAEAAMLVSAGAGTCLRELLPVVCVRAIAGCGMGGKHTYRAIQMVVGYDGSHAAHLSHDVDGEGPLQDTKEAATPVVSARSTGLALQLDDGTRKSHSVAENTAFVTGFFKVRGVLNTTAGCAKAQPSRALRRHQLCNAALSLSLCLSWGYRGR